MPFSSAGSNSYAVSGSTGTLELTAADALASAGALVVTGGGLMMWRKRRGS